MIGTFENKQRHLLKVKRNWLNLNIIIDRRREKKQQIKYWGITCDSFHKFSSCEINLWEYEAQVVTDNSEKLAQIWFIFEFISHSKFYIRLKC